MLGAGLLIVALPVPPLASAAAWLAWLPSVLLADAAHLLAALPGALLAFGELPVTAVAALYVLLVGVAIVSSPEVRAQRTRSRAWLAGRPRPALVAMTGIFTVALVGLAWSVGRPDGLVHLRILRADTTTAIVVRGPAGETFLAPVAIGDGIAGAELAARALPVWEHGFSAAVVPATSGDTTRQLLHRYPAARQITGCLAGRVDLGGGARIEAYGSGERDCGVALVYRSLWVPLAGRPPAPRLAPDGDRPLVVVIGDSTQRVGDVYLAVGAPAQPRASYALPLPADGILDLSSDGRRVWITSS
jgi:hypothetical protein